MYIAVSVANVREVLISWLQRLCARCAVSSAIARSETWKMRDGFGECELYVVFAVRFVWLQCVVFLVLVSDMSGKLEDLQTGLADKGEDWLREQLASLTLGPLRVIAGELGLSRGGSKAEVLAAIVNEMSAQAVDVIAPGGKVVESELTCDRLNERHHAFYMI